MTTREGPTNFPMLGGMNYSVPPHLVGPNEWHFARDVRVHDQKLKQNLRHRLLGALPIAEPVLGLYALPVGYPAHAHFVAITNRIFWQLRHTDVVNSVLIPYKDFQTGVPSVNFGGQRPAVVMYNDELWISSPVFPLHSCNGANIYTPEPSKEHNNTAVTLNHLTDVVTFGAAPIIFPVGCKVVLNGTLPPELSAGVEYFAINPVGLTIQLSTTATGSAILFSGNGANVTLSTAPKTQPLPKAKYLEVFYDHIFAANVSFRGENAPWRVMWSHLYDPWTWVPSPENEADSFDVTEWQSGSIGSSGITGLKRINDVLYVYTADAVLYTPYVGLPKIVHFKPLTTAHGNTAPNALASNGQEHFFYDEKVRDFFRLSPQGGIVSIGKPIRKHLLDTSTPASRFFMLAQVLPEFEEVWWTLDYTPFDFWYVYNWGNNSWHIRNRYVDVENQPISCIGPTTAYRAKTLSELSGQIQGLTGTIESLTDTQVSGESRRLYGNNIGKVFRDQHGFDLAADLVDGQTPYVETGDRVYGDPYTIKEVDAITIHANYRAGTNVRINVTLLINDFVGNYSNTLLVDCGNWTRDLEHGRLTFPKQSGRVFRWRFTFQADSRPVDFEFFGFKEHVYNGTAEV